ncbi:MAG: phage tail tube protein [Tabrizicola sp.]
MARQPGARAALALAFETVYGTPPASGYLRMPLASASLGAQQELLASELLGYGRDPLAPVLDAVTADGDVVVPMDARAFGHWLKGAFGVPTTTGAGPYTHVFQSGLWSLPSMAIEVQMPQVPRFAMYRGCVVDKVNWTMQRSGLLTATVSVVAQGETVQVGSAAGALTDIPLARFSHFQGSLERDGLPLGSVISAEFTYANNLDRIEVIRGDGMIDGADPAQATLTGRITMRLASTALIDQAISGAPCELEAAWVSGSDSLTFTAHAVHLSRPRVPLEGPQGVQVTFDFQGAQGGLGSRLCTATLVNDVASYA